MTLSAGTDPEDKNSGTPLGTALAPTPEAAGIDPFLASAEVPKSPRSLSARLLDYSAHAAMIVGLIGFAWTVSDHVVKRETARPEASARAATDKSAAATPAIETAAAATAPTAAAATSSDKGPPVGQTMPAAPVRLADTSPVAAPAAAGKPAETEEIAELRHANRQLASEIKSLHASLDSLRTSVARDKTAEEVRSLAAGLETVKSGLTSTKTETNAEIAQLSGKVEKLQQPSSRMQQLVDRLGKLEHQSVDTTSTGSLPPAAQTAKAAPTPPAKPTKLASAEDDHGSVLNGWVVRDVYDGVAIIQGRRGQIEVVPGVSIPGAGVVKSIDRHGPGWTVTTSKGVIAYAAPSRDYRRGAPRDDFYGNRYDF